MSDSKTIPVFNFFRDRSNQTEFANTGYLKLKIVDKEQLNSLNNLFYKYFPGFSHEKFIYSNFLNNKEDNQSIQEEIIHVLKPSLDAILKDYRIVLGLFYIKPSGEKSDFYLHRDWTIVDESKYSSINIWLPLVETNNKNGNLVVYPGSHLKWTLRGSPELRIPKEGFWNKILNVFKKNNVFTSPGEAIFFDHRILHSSNKNISGNVRVVAAVSIIPSRADLMHYHINRNKEVVKYKVPDNFYLHLDTNFSEHLDKAELVEVLHLHQ